MSSSAPTNQARLLWRGSLSLPDSDIELEGFTFSSADPYLLENPTALTLESMRGRRTLRFLGTAKLKDLFIDPSGGVFLDIYPAALISREYFQNTFCLFPITNGRSEIGIRVALGDSGPDTTEIIIYASPSPIRPSNPPNLSLPPPIELRVGRITPAPPARLPRPDDPTPRKPPLMSMLGSAKKRTASFTASRTLSRTSSQIEFGGPTAKRRKLESTASSSKLGTELKDMEFKIPVVPTRKGKEKAAPNVIDVDMEETVDPFGKPKLVKMAPLFNNVKSKPTAVAGPSRPRAKPKPTHEEEEPEIVLLDMQQGKIEKANKTLVKQTAMDYLYKRGIKKVHPEFKDLFSFIHRGATFALRKTFKRRDLNTKAVERIVKGHIQLYLDDPENDGGGDTDPASSPVADEALEIGVSPDVLSQRTQGMLLNSPPTVGMRLADDPLTSPVREKDLGEGDDVFG